MSDGDDSPTLAARLSAAADADRRRIERDLHDGAQQDLVALAVNLQLARALADADLSAAKSLLDQLQRDVQETLDRLRSLAHGVYPSLLPLRGLADALLDRSHRDVRPRAPSARDPGDRVLLLHRTAATCGSERDRPRLGEAGNVRFAINTTLTRR